VDVHAPDRPPIKGHKGLSRGSPGQHAAAQVISRETARGEPLHVTPLPKKLMLEQVLPDWLQMARELEAFHSGDRSMLLWQVLKSHQTRSYDQAVTVLEDLLAMERNAEMNAAFKYPEGW
jgi:alpha-galactosidase/6-phospho-beta-glucosidase family protein